MLEFEREVGDGDEESWGAWRLRVLRMGDWVGVGGGE